MKKAIVTGANGFIGKALARCLAERGVEVYAVVRRSAGHLQGLEKCNLVECDLAEYSELGKLLPKGADVFYHFAWTGSAGTLRGDEQVQLTNVQASCHAVRSAAQAGCKRFVFASSIMEYEVAELMKTSAQPSITTVYSTAKITANYMARAIAAQAGVEYIAAVISNIYGPGETSPRLINSSLRKMLRGERVSFSPGEQLYDFVYISDAVAMFAAVGEQGKTGRTYYIGNEHPRQLKSFLREMHQLAAPDTELGLGDLPFNGVSLTYQEFDTHSVYDDTDFRITTTFEQGVKKTLEWIKKQEESL